MQLARENPAVRDVNHLDDKPMKISPIYSTTLRSTLRFRLITGWEEKERARKRTKRERDAVRFRAVA